MKQISCLLLSILFIFSVCAPATANNRVDSTDIEFFSDGSYLVTILNSSIIRSTAKPSKTASYYTSNGELLWSYTVTATFNYNGTTVNCTSVTDDYNIQHSSWHCDSHSTSYTSNTASGTITMKQKAGILTLNTITRTVMITCDKNGNIS